MLNHQSRHVIGDSWKSACFPGKNHKSLFPVSYRTETFLFITFVKWKSPLKIVFEGGFISLSSTKSGSISSETIRKDIEELGSGLGGQWNRNNGRGQYITILWLQQNDNVW